MEPNGETIVPHSAFFSHLGSLPVISDGVTLFKGHPVGQKSISVSQSVYDAVLKPLSPFLAKANTYAGPFVTKADRLADSGLVKLEERVPIVKEPTEKLKARVARLPAYSLVKDAFAFGLEKTDYALKIYGDEYNKSSNGQKSLISAAVAGVSTTFIIASRSMGWIAAYVKSKKESSGVNVESSD